MALGFCDIGRQEDIFIPGNRTLGAIDGDQVVVKLFSTDNGADGEVVKIVKPVERLVGRVVKVSKNSFLEQDNNKNTF